MKIFRKSIDVYPNIDNYNVSISTEEPYLSITLSNDYHPIFILGGKYYSNDMHLEIEGCYNDSGNYGKENYIPGLGSVVMKKYLEICNEVGIKSVSGDIIEKHWRKTGIRKLKGFYEKFGFTVVLNRKTKTGKILLKL